LSGNETQAAKGRGRPSEIIGIISKEHIADSVVENIKPFV
jgi:hypothetical protein